MLHIVTHGAPSDRPPLLIAHGLFGSARNWGVIAKRLSDERQVIAVDIRNHGESPWYDSHQYSDLAADLTEVINSLSAPVDLIGHSMGGKTAMFLALSRPELLRKVIIADIAPVAYSHSQSHLIKAMRSIDLSEVEKRSEADAQLQLSVEEPTIRAFLLQSLDVKAKRWRLNLDILESEMDDITGWPSMSGQSNVSLFFLLGADSTYMDSSGRTAAKQLFPNARYAKLSGAGHWLHAEKPREFEATVRFFLNN